MTKKEKVKQLFDEFNNYIKNNKVHDSEAISLMTLGYQDLNDNWNDEHADIFIDAMNNILGNLKNNIYINI